MASLYRAATSYEAFEDYVKLAEKRVSTGEQQDDLASIKFWLEAKAAKLDAKLRASIAAGLNGVCSLFDDPKIRVVDCRHYFDGRVGRDEYAKGHLPGAVHLDWSTELSDKAHPLASKVAPPDKVKRAMESIGVGDDTLLVGYDDEGGHFVSRLWLVLRAYSKDRQLRILEGGLTKWLAEGRPLTTDEPASARRSLPPARPTPATW